MAPVDKLKPQCVGYYKYHDVILGKGNFATVYLARHKVIGCEVALKVINTNEIEEDYVTRNLTREARILRDLHHPNIIRLYETVKSVNLYCLSLELIRGVNLYQYMMNQEGRRISEKLARIFFYQMLSAVKYMHHLHVIHRDLKLENILVEFGHAIKIVDFGLSNVYYPCYRLRTHCGSVEYAAPELFRSMSVYGTAADLWSLGVILYTMVVGKMPFAFGRDKSKYSESARKRELFLQRISKGLMQENWELMEELSPDCWNLLHDLLQPDQFRRIRIEDAIAHHWITKDEHLKKRLPQSRKDLQRKFHPEIVNYLAHKLNTSTVRIEKHINVRPNDKIACMFYIVRDILIKEVLHPPKVFESSFLYRFECWRQHTSSLYTIRQSSKFEEYRMDEEHGHLSEGYETMSPKSVLISASNVNSNSNMLSSANIDRKDSEEGKLIHRLKRIDLLKPLEKSTKKLYRILSTSGNDEPDNNNNKDLGEETTKGTRNPYRSYKNSRPGKVTISRGKPTNKPSDPQLDMKRQSTKEKCYENKQHLAENNAEFHKDENDTKAKTHEENSLTLYSDKCNKEGKSKTNIEQNKFTMTKTKTKLNSSLRDSVDLKKSKYHKTKTEDSKIILKKSQPEILTRQMTENRISLLTRTQKCTADYKNKEAVKTENTPSKIPVKSVRYGPPAPFSQPVNTDIPFKQRRTSVAERINLCKGDASDNHS